MSTPRNTDSYSPQAQAVAVTWSAIAEHRSYLIKYAQRRLLDPSLAEDLVHDVLEVVMTGRASFGGRSTLRTWLVAILRNKIVDLIRERAGHYSLETLHDDKDDAAIEFECPQCGPAQRAEHRQHLCQTLQRISALPEGLRNAIELRVLQDKSGEEVCRQLAISKGNLLVRLHRARRHLAA